MPNPVLPVSGLYVHELELPLPDTPAPASFSPDMWNFLRRASELWPTFTTWRLELRLDVDGIHPLNTASITTEAGFGKTHWVAKLILSEPGVWRGTISYHHGYDGPIEFTHLKIAVARSRPAGQLQARLTLLGNFQQNMEITLDRESKFFHPLEIEIDYTALADPPTLEVDLSKFPNGQPIDLDVPSPLSLQKTYERAGFEVALNKAANAVSGASISQTAGTGLDEWTEDELNEALKNFWSAYANVPQWALWLFFADRFKYINTLGYMFDVVDPQRQGAAIFKYRFDRYYTDPLKVPPEEDQAAWQARSEFFVAVHEAGHAFNLHHAWEPVQWCPQFPFSNDNEARTFMNYPWCVSGGPQQYDSEAAFYKTFRYCFTKQELIFLRHAPEEFVQMGRDWWDGENPDDTDQLSASLDGPGTASEDLELHLRPGRPAPIYSFLEPIHLDIILSSHGREPRVLDPGLLCGGDSLTLIIARQGGRARRWTPYGRFHQAPFALVPGRPLARSLFISAGRGGWYLAEPGTYTVRAVLNLDGEGIVSNPLRLRILGPRNRREDTLALDFFTDDVGRTLFFHGSHSERLAGSMDLLRIIVEDPDLAGNPAVFHARYALERVRGTGFKKIVFPGRSADARALFADRTIQYLKPEAYREATAELEAILMDDRGPEWFGHVEYAQRCLWWATRQQTELAGPEETRVMRHLHGIMSPAGLSPILTTIAEDWPARQDPCTNDNR
jgi:hypothetical protein